MNANMTSTPPITINAVLCPDLTRDQQDQQLKNLISDYSAKLLELDRQRAEIDQQRVKVAQRLLYLKYLDLQFRVR